MCFRLDLSRLVIILFAFPLTYFTTSYIYLAWWHKKIFLLDTLVHENGRLTLLGSLFYFDHFVALVPMITVFSLCTAGGFALSGRAPSYTRSRAAVAATVLLLGSGALVLLAFVVSIYTVGWQPTVDYALQRIERDGIMSKGGNWNQLQLSNIPIALGTIGLSTVFVAAERERGGERNGALVAGAISCMSAGGVFCIGMTALNWNGWQAFLNPRWLGHSIREIGTYPLTGIPIALASVLLVEYYLSGLKTWIFELRWSSLSLIGGAVALTAGELILLRDMDVLVYAQIPSFAPNCLSNPHLLSSHVFEHFLDFVLIGPLTGGIYALVRLLGLKQRPGLTSLRYG